METRASKQRRMEASMTEAMSTDLILKEVIKYLPLPDQLQAAMVNHQWKSVARSAAREGSPCLAVIRLGTLEQLLSFKALLLSSFDLPFNGLMFRLRWHWTTSRCLDENPSDLRLLESESIPWHLIKIRRVSIVNETLKTWCFHSMHSARCQSILMLHQVWSSVATNVEHLSVQSISFPLKFSNPDGTLICPNLRTIEWPTSGIKEPYFECDITSTDKLTELVSDVSQHTLHFVTKHGKPQFVKLLRIFNAQHPNLLTFAQEGPPLRQFDFYPMQCMACVKFVVTRILSGNEFS